VLEAIGVPTRRPAREIELVARDSRFNGVNPTIEVAPGERLRLVVKNDDPETWHDLVIGGLDGQRTTLLAPGESATLEFTAPASGILKYGCSVHPRFMDGRIVVARRRS
jgi:plastocyanin